MQFIERASAEAKDGYDVRVDRQEKTRPALMTPPPPFPPIDFFPEKLPVQIGLPLSHGGCIVLASWSKLTFRFHVKSVEKRIHKTTQKLYLITVMSRLHFCSHPQQYFYALFPMNWMGSIRPSVLSWSKCCSATLSDDDAR